MSADVPAEVLIPHRDRATSLRRTLDSLAAQTVPVRVCVADNGSADGSPEMLRAAYPQVRVLELGRNLGFGAAVNRAAAGSTAPLLVLINNDAVAEPSFVERLLDVYRTSGAEMVAGCMLSADGAAVESLGVEVDRSLNPYDSCHGLAPDDPALMDSAPLGPSGGAALYERAAFTALGGFDERLFAYLEDVDLAIRARLAGYRCAAAPRARVRHDHSATLGVRSDAKNRLLGYSRGFLSWRYGRNLGVRDRAWALCSELVVYGGKALIDRNLGGPRGRWRAWRALREPRPAAEPGWSELPLIDPGRRASLARRLARRRSG